MPESRPPKEEQAAGSPENARENAYAIGSEHVATFTTKDGREGTPPEFRSSEQGRKILILKRPPEGEEISPTRTYLVRIVEDTRPDDPTKGKLIAEIIEPVIPDVLPDDVVVPEKENKEKEPRSIPPIEVREEDGVVYVLESLMALGKRGKFTPDIKRFKHFTLDQRTLETLEKIATAVQLREPCLLEGETATSKTSSIEYLAAVSGHEVRRINLNGQTDTSELIGKFVPNDGSLEAQFEDMLRHPEMLTQESKSILARAKAEARSFTLFESQKIAKAEGIEIPNWRWKDGIVPEAMKKGQWVIFDEMNLAEPQVLERLNSVLEKHPSLVLSEDGGRVIGGEGGEEMHEDCRFFGTQNPAGAEYVGRNPLSPAYKDRFPSYKYVQSPTEGDYKAMMELMVFGDQPEVEIGGTKYHAPSVESKYPALEKIPDITQTLYKVAAFQAKMEDLARRRVIGRGRKEKYVFSRRSLIQFMEFLAEKTIIDRKGGHKKTIETHRKEIFLKALQYYYLDKMTDQADLQQMQDQLNLLGLSETTWGVTA